MCLGNHGSFPFGDNATNKQSLGDRIALQASKAGKLFGGMHDIAMLDLISSCNCVAGYLNRRLNSSIACANPKKIFTCTVQIWTHATAYPKQVFRVKHLIDQPEIHLVGFKKRIANPLAALRY